MLGTSLLGMVAPSCVGLTQHARLGNVDWRMAAGLAAGTAVGSAAGSQVAVNAPAGQLGCQLLPQCCVLAWSLRFAQCQVTVSVQSQLVAATAECFDCNKRLLEMLQSYVC